MKYTENISDFLFEFAGKNPETPAILHPVLITYSDLCRIVDSYASGFIEAGIEAGTKTIILLRQGPDLFAVTLALFRIGAIPVMIDPGMGIRSMTMALRKAEAGAFIGIPGSLLLRFIYPEAFCSVKIWISSGFSLPGKSLSLNKFKDYHKIITSAYKPDQGAVAAIFFTSGSTGPAKAVIYKNYMLAAQRQILKDHFGYKPGETDLCTFPLIGLLLLSLGISEVLADMDMTKPASFKPERLISNINRFSCTHMFCSPMILGRLASYGNQNNIKVPSLKMIMTAGAPVLPGVLRETRKWIHGKAAIHTPYGATEALPVTDICDEELLLLYGNSDSYPNGICVGYPLKGIDLKIIYIREDNIETWDDHFSVPLNEVGEIAIKGANVTQEYLGDVEANRNSKIYDKDSGSFYHRTGDLGSVDESGRIWFNGRKSQRVVTNEAVLFTIPCEAVFNQHPSVFRSALVGVNIGTGQKSIPVIWIELKKGFRRSEELRMELLNRARESKLTKDISIILFHKRFPVDPRHNAKIFREKLAKQAQKILE